jgi:hypothetical protein
MVTVEYGGGACGQEEERKRERKGQREPEREEGRGREREKAQGKISPSKTGPQWSTSSWAPPPNSAFSYEFLSGLIIQEVRALAIVTSHL